MESNIYVIVHNDAHFENFSRVSCVPQTVT